MRILVVETSTMTGGIAVASQDQILAERRLPGERRHARDLVPLMQELLRDQGWKPRDVDFAIIDIGPGSYTGLRVGVTAIKAFCYATGAGVVGVGACPILAEVAPQDAARIDTLIDAQQGKVYVGRFGRSPGGAIEPRGDVVIEHFESWGASVEDGAWVTGPALERQFSLVPSRARLAPRDTWNPGLAPLWRLGMANYLAGRRDDFWALEPLYLRPSSAETKWTDRAGGGKG